jgi:hypothetical protein
VLQLSKELDLHRNTVGRYHKRICDFFYLRIMKILHLIGDTEMDEALYYCCCKRYKKNQKLMDYQEIRALKKVGPRYI